MSNWTASPTRTFLNELLNLPRNVSRKVPGLIEILENGPISAQGDATKLKGYENNIYRVHVGRDYRLIYSFGHGWIKLLSIRHRSDVYKGELPNDFETPPSNSPDLETLVTKTVTIPHALPPYLPLTPILPNGITTALPYELTESLLKQWQIPKEYWSDLLSIQNSESLLDLPIPHEFINRILDIFFPRPIEELEAQPQYLLGTPKELDRYVEGNLVDFLLKLDPKQERLRNLESSSPLLITGGAGTGKSTLALYRVQKLVELGYKPILFTPQQSR